MLSHCWSAALQLLAIAASAATMSAKPFSTQTQAISEAHFPFRKPATMPNAAPCCRPVQQLGGLHAILTRRWSSRTAHGGSWARAGAA